ncbi:GspH/FimT family pseudopilin [Ramlibacter pallidus]|uniref:Type II secretion system protein H n=1 Tax=Ramlibacter pallidus TaxID=2780087 RepID=A0ABR9S8D8_9BURK|nr:GspH/FimT family pseudopilin [Ramlibacter pallidus]MBE7369795.1 GspH/FimT family pseudopilin [Ramlibacter pallidus]
MRTRRRLAGFTLIEVLVTLAIIGVLGLVAVPSFVEFRRNAELSDSVSNLMLAASTAKTAALKSGRNAFVQTKAATGWGSGWFVYVDTNWDNDYDAGTDELVMEHAALSSDVTVGTSAGSLASNYLMFNGAGFPRLTGGGNGNGSLVLSTKGRSSMVIVDTSGRTRSCKVGTTGCSAL